MTGRQLLARPGYDLDIERVLAACAEHSVAVEVNGNPWRLDLDWRWLPTTEHAGRIARACPRPRSCRHIIRAPICKRSRIYS